MSSKTCVAAIRRNYLSYMQVPWVISPCIGWQV